MRRRLARLKKRRLLLADVISTSSGPPCHPNSAPRAQFASREIEVKYRVPDLDHLEQALYTVGLHLSPPVRQDDQAYAENSWRYGMSKLGVAFARLRTQEGRHFFTLKKPLDNAMVCEEYETEVADRQAMHQAILNMGFYPTVRIVKTRQTAVSDDLSICVDQVENAGCFLELEKLVGTDQSGDVIQAELDSFVIALGVAVEQITDTYDSLVRDALLVG